MDTLVLETRAIAWTYNGDWLRIEAHGPDGLRLRASPFPDRGARDAALLDHAAVTDTAPVVTRDGGTARITHGRITAEVDLQGRVRFLDAKGGVLLEEKWRQRDTISAFWTVGTDQVRTISALGLAC